MAVPSGAMERRTSQFDVARKRAAQTENANLQGNQDAISRKLASSGGGPGGVGIKLQNQATEASARRLADANEGINAQESADIQARDDREQAQRFQTSERLGSQGFSSGENALQRRFATSEREGGQNFAAGEAGKNRTFATTERLGSQGFATTEREGAQDFASGEAGKNREFATGERLGAESHQTDLANLSHQQQVAIMYAQQAFQDFEGNKQLDLAMQQFEHEKGVDAFNMDLATKMFEEKDMLEKLMTGSPLSAEGNPALGQWQGVFKQIGGG